MSEETRKKPGSKKVRLIDLRDDWREIILDVGRSGGSEVKMRVALGVHEHLWYRLIREEPEFKEAREMARDLSQQWWEDCGQMLATGQNTGNATAWVFRMKNSFKWHDRQEIDHRSGDGSMSPTRIEIVPVARDNSAS